MFSRQERKPPKGSYLPTVNPRISPLGAYLFLIFLDGDLFEGGGLYEGGGGL